jgi:hypothetical protein
LKVLLGARRFGVLGAWWDNSGGRSGCESFSFYQTAGVGIFSFFFLFFFLWGVARISVPCGCYINIAGHMPVLRNTKSIFEDPVRQNSTVKTDRKTELTFESQNVFKI